MIAEERCEVTELLVGQCACRRHRGGVAPEEETRIGWRPAGDPTELDGWPTPTVRPKRIVAGFASSCPSCGIPVREGQVLVKREGLFTCEDCDGEGDW